MSEQTTDLTIVRKENVQMIAQSAPQIYKDNTTSSERCTEYGQKLLAQIKANGMNDDLDQQCAVYITKARNTVKKMNTNRSAITKIFDQIRSEFTGMENAVDPTKAGSVPYQIQQQRDVYAARRREEEERRRREEIARQQRQQALSRYRQDVEDDYKSQFNTYAVSAIDALAALNSGLTIQNFEAQSKVITGYPVTLPSSWADSLRSAVAVPPEIAYMADSLAALRSEILGGLMPQFTEQYQFEVAEYRDSIIDTLPSKRTELERIQQAGEEEKVRLAAELKAREQAEAARIEAERRRKEEEEAARKKMQAEASELGGLFGQQAVLSASGYQPKASVKKRIVFRDSQGVIAAVSFWWSKEGQYLPVDELAKIFKKQITYCEKAANDKSHPELITSSSVSYEEEIKAK